MKQLTIGTFAKKGGVNLETVAQLASLAKCDDFCVCLIFCKVTYLFGHRHFAKNRISGKSVNLAHEASYAKV